LGNRWKILQVFGSNLFFGYDIGTRNARKLIKDFTSLVEGVNSSLAQSAVMLGMAKVCPEMINDAFCVTFIFFSKIGFLSHSFGSKYASKPIKDSKETDSRLVSKKDWHPGPGILSQKGENMFALRCRPQRTPNVKQKHFLKSEVEDLMNPYRFEQLFRSISWLAMVLQSSANGLGQRG